MKPKMLRMKPKMLRTILSRNNPHLPCVAKAPAMIRASGFLALISLIGPLLSPTSLAHAADLSGLSFDDRNNIQIACVSERSDGPVAYNQCVQRQLAALGNPPSSIDASTGLSSPQKSLAPVASSTAPAVPTGAHSVPPDTASSPYPAACAENGSCYGDISNITGLPKTVHVNGYFRSDGTYVRGYYRSHR